MPNRGKPKQESQHDPQTDSTEPAEPAEPLNRAERRAMRRGKKAGGSPSGARVQLPGHHDQVLAPRRSGRRGNR
jgi:hypothetical protein